MSEFTIAKAVAFMAETARRDAWVELFGKTKLTTLIPHLGSAGRSVTHPQEPHLSRVEQTTQTATVPFQNATLCTKLRAEMRAWSSAKVILQLFLSTTYKIHLSSVSTVRVPIFGATCTYLHVPPSSSKLRARRPDYGLESGLEISGKLGETAFRRGAAASLAARKHHSGGLPHARIKTFGGRSLRSPVLAECFEFQIIKDIVPIGYFKELVVPTR